MQLHLNAQAGPPTGNSACARRSQAAQLRLRRQRPSKTAFSHPQRQRKRAEAKAARLEGSGLALPGRRRQRVASDEALDLGSILGFKYAWEAYRMALEERPMTTKMWTCYGGQFLGDVVGQSLVAAQQPLVVIPFDLRRHLGLTSFALLIGGSTGHMWHRWLDSHIGTDEPTATGTVLQKLLLDQLVFAPLINCAFLSWLHLTGSGGSPATVVPFVAANIMAILKANWMVWPAANFVTFKFISQDYRILFCNVLSIFWGTFISLMVCTMS